VAVSVIVSNFNGETFLPRLLETLESQEGVVLEIIVVDRNSTDTSRDILARHPAVKVTQEPPESGLVAGYHAGAACARFDDLFFCNEDMWFESDCLRRLESHLNLEAGIGAVMPLQRTYDGEGRVNVGAWFAKTGWARANPYPFRRSEVLMPQQPMLVPGINAGACLISRTVYEDCGAWDTSFFLDYEDMDLSVRMWQRGWKSMIDPTAVAYHAVGASNEKRINAGRSRVGRKRYVWAFSNQLAIIFKTFSGPALFLFPPVLWLDRTARDLLRLRLDNVVLDCAAGWLTLCRLGAFLRYRRANREINRRAPGQRWFTDSAFQVDVDRAA
jgi:GT2 family glycosyltransferase